MFLPPCWLDYIEIYIMSAFATRRNIIKRTSKIVIARSIYKGKKILTYNIARGGVYSNIEMKILMKNISVIRTENKRLTIS